MTQGLLSVPAGTTTLTVTPWPDTVIDTVGLDPRSDYVERYWLGILGPSTTWLLRHLVDGLERTPAGFTLDMAETASRIGVGFQGGRHSPFSRALARLVQFELAREDAPGSLAVRRKVPPLNRRQLARLPEVLQDAHQRWTDGQIGTSRLEGQRRRSRQLALSLLELGEDSEATERQLLRWGYHPALCYESAQWALMRHRQALAAANVQHLGIEELPRDAA
ncbi:MAG TPA: hypothetical protein VMY88_03605 [Acidimicrobiales bacterium]|nr:hypothetical protein [Acidimicrobiales bacterium]